MNTRFEPILINEKSSVKEALKRINSLRGLPLTLFVTDDEGTLVGTLTDGDIRRGLLAEALLSDSVAKVMYKQFRFLRRGDEDAARHFRKARELNLSVLPVIDDCGKILDVIDLRHTSAMLPLDAVLMAGGRGERLRPLTENVPKPLLPVGGKPIIDYNVEALRRCGISNIFVTVNYLHSQIEDHFANSEDFNTVKCVLEPAPLGTFGSIGLVNGLKHRNVLVMNSDLLTSINFEEMYEHHLNTEAALTMAVTSYTVSVPYAIVRTHADRVESFQEKPTYNFFANAGIYIVNRDLLASVTGKERVDATDFIDSLLAAGQKVAYFPINGTWIDIGSPDDYAMACSKMK
ncbi:MAG: nucleotidyltransferase family protein [Prevotella sp.]|nr:nucleotidyltransferase family protein [Prevotella sp.]MCM1075429.1 nucleotidyltransferase family protein [Ruminococcus sp.]